MTETVLDGFQKTVHELLVIPETGLAYVPIFGDGIHGRNPNPGHVLLRHRPARAQASADTSILSPYSAPHTRAARRRRADLHHLREQREGRGDRSEDQQLIDAIDSGSTNGHRLCIPNDGQRLYTDNEEDATVSVIDLPNRKLLGKIETPQALAGIAVSGDGTTVVAVSDEQPVVFLIDTAAGKVTRDGARSRACRKPAQIARYSPDGKLLVVVEPQQQHGQHHRRRHFGSQTAIAVGSQPMDFAFRGDELFVGCQGDGTMHVIDCPAGATGPRQGRHAAASRSGFSRRSGEILRRHWR